MPDDMTNNLMRTIQRQLGSRWDALSVEDRQLIAEVAVDATGLQLEALSADPNDAEAKAAISAELRQIDAQLANIQSVASAEVRGAFWQAFSAISGTLLHVALASVGVSPAAVAAVGEAVNILTAKPSTPVALSVDPAALPGSVASVSDLPPAPEPIGP